LASARESIGAKINGGKHICLQCFGGDRAKWTDIRRDVTNDFVSTTWGATDADAQIVDAICETTKREMKTALDVFLDQAL
jgi:hypothetical protein